MNLKDFRTTLTCIFCLWDFWGTYEVWNSRISDIVINDSYMAAFIEKTWTNIRRNGNWLYLAKLKSKPFPTTMLRRYMKLVKVDYHSNGFIFRGFSFRLREKEKM